MLQLNKFILLGVSILILSACDQSEGDIASNDSISAETEQQNTMLDEQEAKSQQQDKATSTPTFKNIDWADLMPEQDLEALLNPPSYVTETEDLPLEDRVSKQLLNALEAAGDDRYQQALVSTNVVPEMDGKSVRVPGFIVPLEFNDDQTITQFFLVPFFGACIHVPPPPPNQVIFVSYPQGFKLDDLYDPIWVSGILETSLVQNDMAVAAYSLKMLSFEIYTE